MRPHALIFDFDGTIAASMPYAIEIANRLADEFHYRKLKPEEVEEFRGKTPGEAIRFLGIRLTRLPRIAVRAEHELNRVIERVPPAPGLPEVLRQLKAAGLALGILTSNSMENVTQFLKRHKLDLFDFISASSRIGGKTWRLRRVLKAQSLRPEETIYIGDEIRDIEAARKAGLRVAAVTWGYNSESALAARKPDWLIAKPIDILGLIGYE